MGNNNRNRNNGGGGNNNRQNQQQRPKPKRYKGKNVDPMSGPVQMGRYAGRLFIDMARGNFRLDTDGVHFQNREFILAAINEVEVRIVEQQIYNTSLTYTYGGSNDVNVLRLMERHRRGLDAWMYVRETLIALLNTGDMGLIIGLMSRLPDYRYCM